MSTLNTKELLEKEEARKLARNAKRKKIETLRASCDAYLAQMNDDDKDRSGETAQKQADFAKDIINMGDEEMRKQGWL